MYEPIQDATARSRAMQFIDDLAAAADGSQEQQPGYLPLHRCYDRRSLIMAGSS